MLRWQRFKSEQVRSQHRKVFLWHTGLVVGIIFVCCVIIAQISSLPNLQWDSVRIAGVNNIEEEDIYNLLVPFLDGRIWGVIDRKNRFVFPNTRATDLLRETFPRIKEVTIKRAGKILSVDIVEREPVAAACLAGKTPQKCMLVDVVGFQYASADVIGGLFVYYTEPRIREFVRPTEEFEYLSTMQGRLEKLGLYATSLTLLSDEMALMLRNGTRIRFGLEEHERQFENLATILKSPEYVEETGGDITRVEYFDLRFGDRVYYKLVGEE